MAGWENGGAPQHDGPERAPLQAWGENVKEMIAEVKAVCPGLGDGFVHACLAVFRYNVAAVVNALLEGGALPFPLDTLDRALPSPMQAKRGAAADALGLGVGLGAGERDEEFVVLQKAYVKQMEREQVRACVWMVCVTFGWWWWWWWWRR